MVNKTIKELKEIAKELHIKNWWNLNKAKLIEEIEKVNNMSEEEKVAMEEARQKELELFDHYQKNWSKYGPKNDWTKFLKDYKAGKITLIVGMAEVVEDDMNEKSQDAAEGSKQANKDTFDNEQVNNKVEIKKVNKKLSELTYKGKTQSIRAWAEELNIPWPTLYDRVNRNGWSVEDAIEIPLGQRRKRSCQK